MGGFSLSRSHVLDLFHQSKAGGLCTYFTSISLGKRDRYTADFAGLR
jgi:hypothetical protein